MAKDQKEDKPTTELRNYHRRTSQELIRAFEASALKNAGAALRGAVTARSSGDQENADKLHVMGQRYMVIAGYAREDQS